MAWLGNACSRQVSGSAAGKSAPELAGLAAVADKADLNYLVEASQQQPLIHAGSGTKFGSLK